jgi:integrase/recombinase XerC
MRALEPLITDWLTEKSRSSGSPRTCHAYRETLHAFRAALQAEGLDLDSETGAVRRVAAAWAEHSVQQGKQVARSTCNTRLAIVSSFYKFVAQEKQYELPNPIEAIKRAKTRKYTGAQPLDPTDVQHRLATIDRTTLDGRRDYALLMMGLFVGRRVSELASLRWQDIRTTGTKVTVTFRRCKGGTTMVDVLPGPSATALLDYLAAHYGPRLAVLSPTAPVWVSYSPRSRGQPLAPRTIDAICRARLGQHVSPHALRHTFALLMQKAGATTSDIQGKLGHSNLDTTDRYLRALQAAENPYADEMARLLGVG